MEKFIIDVDVNMIEAPVDGKGGIHLGNWRAAKDVAYLQKHGITHMLSAIPAYLSKFEELEGLDIEQKVIDSQDNPSFNLYVHLEEAADFINQAVSKGNVLVHCAAGISRSSTCLIAYYIKHRNMTTENALKLIRKQRDCATPNRGFHKQLKRYEDEVNGK